MRATGRWALAVGATVIAVVAALLLMPDAEAPTSSSGAAPSPTQAARPDPGLPAGPDEDGAFERRTFDRSRRSTDDPSSSWVVVNKARPIRPLGFRPDLVQVRGYQVAVPVAAPLRRLMAASDTRRLRLKIASAFRSYGYQAGVYAATVAARGVAAADRVSARPGYSEHQTGLAVDLVVPGGGCNFAACFAGTPAGRWLARNAWRFGFVVRYQPGTQVITGYAPEPWHLRFVGRALAAELRRTGTRTLERFFDVRGGDYRA